MEDFSRKVSKVTHDKYENWFNDANVIGESSYESGSKTPDDSDQGTAQRDDGERSETIQNVSILDVFCSHSDVGVKQFVKHLKGELK